MAEEVVKIAAEAAQSESSSNESDLRLRHIGYYLIDDGFRALEQSLGVSATLRNIFRTWLKRNIFFIYSGSILSVVVAGLVVALAYVMACGGSWLWIFAVVLFFGVPVSEFAINFVQWLVTKFTSPVPLPKLDFEDGISDSARTAVVVQTMFSDMDTVTRTIENLEIRAIGNMDPNLAFGVLADLPEASSEVLPGDTGVINRAKELIAALNERYCPNRPPRFFMMCRKRVFNDKEGKFMPWERKRGKIMEFNRLLRGETKTTFNVIAADLDFLRGCRFVITLDNDTQLPRGVAQKLVGTAAHPLNRAVFNPQTDTVLKGYSIIQPRVGITLQSGSASRFAAIFSGHAGLDPYTRTVSDVYQDLFKEASYIGKGIYDIDAFERALGSRFPENSLLSHDLIECLFARCGLASDVEVFDDYPMRYHAQARRQHRWMRGDWQLLPWLRKYIPNERGGLYPSPIGDLGRWKLLDNLRRSLFPPMFLVALFAIWWFAPGSQWLWLAGWLGVVSFPLFVLCWRLVFDLPFGYSFSSFFFSLFSDVKKQLQLLLLQLVFLPHQAYVAIDAITVTLYRLYFSKKHLLEWETAHATEKRLGGNLRDFTQLMWPIYPLLFLCMLLTSVFCQPGAGVIAGLFFAVWLCSP
ncbi:MAG TPA: hypothetical protein PLP17_09425, partial [Oligoflexia bacterium]|nr:hypothetical protein [Oligoflexia bacterium]